MSVECLPKIKSLVKFIRLKIFTNSHLTNSLLPHACSLCSRVKLWPLQTLHSVYPNSLSTQCTPLRGNSGKHKIILTGSHQGWEASPDDSQTQPFKPPCHQPAIVFVSRFVRTANRFTTCCSSVFKMRRNILLHWNSKWTGLRFLTKVFVFG